MHFIHALLSHATLRPDAPALISPQGILSWSALLARVRALAAGLASRGVTHRSRVACILHNDPVFIELMLAAHWLGASLCPLNPRLTPAELQRQLAHLDPQAVILDDALPAPALPRAALLWYVHPTQLAPMQTARDTLDALYNPALPPPAPSRDPALPALLIASSGTTGTPRHAILSHQALAASARQFIEVLGLTHTDRQLAVAPLAHIAGLGVFTLPLLLVGGATIFPDDTSPSAVWDRLCQRDISCVFMVPTRWATLLKVADARETHLRAAVSGGAFCPAPLREAWLKRRVPLWIGYGMTEAAPMVTLLSPDLHAHATDVGLPGPHIELAIEAPDEGGIGRVCVLAPNLMDGYWGDPEASDDALRDGWLRTQDVGWIDERKHLHLVGRLDDVIISGAMKLHPAEIELALSGIPGVLDLAVVPTPHPVWGQLVTAVLLPAPDTHIDLAALHAHLDHHAQLARFKYPRRFVLRRHELPRSPNGKLLRRALNIDPREIVEERLP
jgi:acyl-CoA synthetase (AMP-forming)/AMP-acid ligase II